MSKNALVTIVIILVILVGFSLYFSRNKTVANDTVTLTPRPTETSSAIPTQTVSVTGPEVTATVPGSAQVKSFVVNGSNFAFSPSTISVNKGDRVKITLNNTGGFHDLRVEGYNVGTPKINGGAQASFEFVADKAGSFEYYCSVGEHRAMGMKGTLIVK